MLAIQTRFIGPTNHRPARIQAHVTESAQDGKRRRVTVSWDHALNVNANHDAAAAALITKLGWGGRWLAGDTVEGRVYVRVVSPIRSTCGVCKQPKCNGRPCWTSFCPGGKGYESTDKNLDGTLNVPVVAPSDGHGGTVTRTEGGAA